MDAIGSESFVFVTGQLDRPGKTYRDITRPGTDGVGFSEEGVRGKVTELRCGRDYANVAAAEAAIDAYKALHGTVVAISQYGVNRGVVSGDDGIHWLILNVEEIPQSRHTAGVATGGVANGLTWMETLWSVVWVEDEAA